MISTKFRGGFWLMGVAGVALLTGCASQGPLRPPSMHLPAAVERFSVQRFGNTVELAWTTPDKTTDGIFLVTRKRNDGPLNAEICREAAASPTCTPFVRVPVEAGKQATYTDHLPEEWQRGPERELLYRVRVLNGNGKGAGWTDAGVVGGGGPAAMTDLQAARSADGGVVLRWKPGPEGDPVLIRVVRGANPVGKKGLLQVPAQAADRGGAVDGNAKPGVEQHYVAYRTRSVELHGKTLKLNGASASVSVSADAVAAPAAAPAGLEAVVNTLGAAEIDLVWQPSVDSSAVSYRVFRAEGDGPMQVLAAAVRGFSFSDTTVRAGGTYRYAVAAVNAAGAVGPQSAEIRRNVPQP